MNSKKCEYNFEYKGYRYQPYEDVEPEENVKIIHFVASTVEQDFKPVIFDWSPYSTPTEDDFRLWIDLGLPERITEGRTSTFPLNRKDLNQILNARYDKESELIEKDAEEFYLEEN